MSGIGIANVMICFVGGSLGVMVLLGLVTVLAMYLTSPDFERYAASDHYDPVSGRFFNTPASIPPKKGTLRALWQMIVDAERFMPSEPLPVVKTDWQEFLKPSSKAALVWFGHSAFMLRMDGQTFLVDPAFAAYASPVPITMKRFAPAPQLSALPKVDVIVYSHAHYDHLDAEVVRFYRHTQTRFLVPLGMGAYLKKWGIASERITELDWWQSVEVGAVTVLAVPTRHDSARTAFDAKKSLWAGWVFDGAERIYYSADSSYAEHFEHIGARFESVDLALVENGQYNELWADNHLFPNQSVQVVQDVKAKRWMPVHWGAYALSTHDWLAPVADSSLLSDAKGLSMLTPKIGQVVRTDSVTDRWWEALR